MLGTAQRVIESAVIAVATSTGLYLVGSVYTDAYYGRMSIEVTALDLAPPFIALQSAHVLQSLLQYPATLVSFYLLYRLVSSRLGWLRVTYDRILRRFGRLFLLIVNLAIVAPLLAAGIKAGLDEATMGASSILSEVAGLMGSFGLALLIYVFWLSLGRREIILSQIRARKIIPIVLLFALYLLDALIATANEAAADAELLMTGLSNTSTTITFTMTAGVRGPPGTELIFVTARNGSYFVVERQPVPPSQRPVAYAIPIDAVDFARVQRINDSDQNLIDVLEAEFSTPEAD